MRVISQDGTLDMPYEEVIIQRFRSRIYFLNKNLIGVESLNEDMQIAEYSTEEKAKKALMVELITKDDIKLSRIAAVTASICAKKENATEKRWMFDFDIDNEGKLEEFVSDIKEICFDMVIETHKTPHGYAVIVEHGFDTRKLFEKWTEDVTLKRDDMLLVYWDTKEK